jgi:hypothetical protein
MATLAVITAAAILHERPAAQGNPVSGNALAAFLQAGRQAASSTVPDLSGDWAPDPKRGGIGQSLSISDNAGRNRGKEPDIPYQPWALKQTLSERPSTGGGSEFDKTTDPQVLYCEPPGVPHIYLWPIKTKFVQTAEAVFILHELGPFFRMVRLNSKHPEDPDPQWWGHSIGWYENGDTLVVDTVGFNDKTWLDQVGHPHTEKLHLIERYKRVDRGTLELEMTIDDPGAYTKPWNARRNFILSTTGFMRYQQICSIRENQQFFDNLAKPAIAPAPGK